jgi:hypothetical protein
MWHTLYENVFFFLKRVCVCVCVWFLVLSHGAEQKIACPCHETGAPSPQKHHDTMKTPLQIQERCRAVKSKTNNKKKQ